MQLLTRMSYKLHQTISSKVCYRSLTLRDEWNRVQLAFIIKGRLTQSTAVGYSTGWPSYVLHYRDQWVHSDVRLPTRRRVKRWINRDQTAAIKINQNSSWRLEDEGDVIREKYKVGYFPRDQGPTLLRNQCLEIKGVCVLPELLIQFATLFLLLAISSINSSQTSLQWKEETRWERGEKSECPVYISRDKNRRLVYQ